MTIPNVLIRGVALAAAAACAACERSQDAPANPTTDPEMRQALGSDLGAANTALSAFLDPIHTSLGDPTSATLRGATALWDQYRRAECESVRAAFAPGTMAPVAQLACLVAVTDARHKLLGEQYDFIRPAPETR